MELTILIPVLITACADDRGQVLQMAPGPTEADVAADLRRRAQGPLTQLAALMDEARSYGLRLGFTVQTDAHGRAWVPPVDIIKPL